MVLSRREAQVPVLAFVFLYLCLAEFSGNVPAQQLRTLSYNIHHAEGVDGSLDVSRIAKVIRESRADLVALQEVDVRVSRSDGVDQATQLAERLGMHVEFGANIALQGGEYGNAVLSRFPIVRAKNHLLPNLDNGEQRGVLECRIELPNGQDMRFFATHFDHRRKPDERIASAKAINDLVAEDSGDALVLLAGDLNDTLGSQTLIELQNRWKRTSPTELATIPVGKPARQIDFIMMLRNEAADEISGLHTEVLSESVASDHRPILAVCELQQTTEAALTKVLVGSCIRQDKPVPILRTMREENAQLVLFLGDNIYADTSDVVVMRSKYDRLGADEGFQLLMESTDSMATWDDHDFGINDGGADFKFRDRAQQEFMRFWKEPKGTRRRITPGVYESRIFGPDGKRVQVIMLDTRYFRSVLKKGERRVGGPYVTDPNPEKTVLGETQWEWLEKQLRKPAELRLIGTSIQCIASDSGQETWSNLPLERQRFFDLIRTTGAEGVVLLSGDRHWSELSVLKDATNYPLYELTSSSLNQNHERGTPTDNHFRDLAKTYHQPNYGVVHIDWAAGRPQVTLEIRDIEGRGQFAKVVTPYAN